jgi:hypothetical protein
MSQWRSKGHGANVKHFKLQPKTIYGPAKFQKYSNLVDMKDPASARASVLDLTKEYNDAEERSKKVRVKRVLVDAANRCEIASHNMNYSEEERKKFAEIEKIYRAEIAKMVLPPKTESSKKVELPSLKDKNIPMNCKGKEKLEKEKRDEEKQFIKNDFDKKERKEMKAAENEDKHKAEEQALKNEENEEAEDAAKYRMQAEELKQEGLRKDANKLAVIANQEAEHEETEKQIEQDIEKHFD